MFCPVSSGGSAECRFADTLPWNELETVQGREQVLLGAVDFSSFESIWPTSGMPYDTVCKLARKLVARHDLPLFAHSPPTDTTPAATSSSPEPPEHSATSVETPNSTISPKRRQSRDTHSPELTTQPPLLEPALPLATFLSDQPVFTAILPTGTLTQIHTVLPCPPSPGAAQAFADNVSPESSHDPAHKNSMMANNAVAETEQHHDSGAAAITVSTEVPKKRKKSTQAAPVLSPKRLRTRPPKVIVQKSKSAATTAATYVIINYFLSFTHHVLLVSHLLAAVRGKLPTSDSCSTRSQVNITLLTVHPPRSQSLTLSPESSTIQDNPGLSYSPSPTSPHPQTPLFLLHSTNPASVRAKIL